MRYLYTLALSALTPFLLARSARKYRGLSWAPLQRLGFQRPQIDRPIWIHAASVGESRAIAPIANELAQHYPVLITTTTPTGADQVRQLCPDAKHAYVPYDLPWAVKYWVKRLNPRALLLVETELWPNLIHAARQQAVPIALVNGRLSQKSARGYQRMRSLARNMFTQLDLCLVQTADHAAEFEALGASPLIVGNVKFDTQLPDSTLPEGDWWVAASTHPEEESACYNAFMELSQSHPSLRLLMVPRHPERFDQLAAQFPCGRASLNQWDETVVLGDAMGQLGGWLNGAKLAFIGGTLNPRGSQSPIEAALGGASIVAGPSRYNFAQVYEWLSDGALTDLDGPENLAAAIESALAKDGAQNQQIVQAHQGATQRTLDALNKLLQKGS